MPPRADVSATRVAVLTAIAEEEVELALEGRTLEQGVEEAAAGVAVAAGGSTKTVDVTSEQVDSEEAARTAAAVVLTWATPAVFDGLEAATTAAAGVLTCATAAVEELDVIDDVTVVSAMTDPVTLADVGTMAVAVTFFAVLAEAVEAADAQETFCT